ncbi:MAG: hypothetical protein PHI27_05875 [Eubacteriales bacterium]|nr:hypothetical protein [Eubacteriales bacterium]
MTIQTNITTNRKALANRISQELLGAPVTYSGVPSCAYRVGACITIDREGNIEITNSDAVKILMPFFIEQGWHTAEATEEPVEPAADSETAEAPAEAAAENIVDPERVTGIDDCTISLPADMTVAQITNLVHMLYSEQRLLNKAAMDGRLTIPESLITRLTEYTPETPEAFADLLNDFKALGELAGMSYENGVVSMDFPHDDAHPEHGITYAGLVERIIHAAKESTRIKAEIKTSENEKYYMRAWLLRLGYGGADLKAERRLLLRNLKGHSAFPTDAAAEKHKEKYAALRRASREIDAAHAPLTEAEQEGGVQDE